MPPLIDFSYAFATPHRLCIAKPDSSTKTLLDASPLGLTLTFGYNDLTRGYPGAFKPVLYEHSATLTAAAASGDGPAVPMPGLAWQRLQGWMPGLVYRLEAEGVRLTITAAAGPDADILRLDLTRLEPSRAEKRVTLTTTYQGLCFNSRWMDPDCPYEALMAHNERSDLVFFCAANRPSPLPLQQPNQLAMQWRLAPEETTAPPAYLIRPHHLLEPDIQPFLARDWEAELQRAIAIWQDQFALAPQISLPDPQIQNAYYAGLADIFVMREPLADGRVAGVAGTQMYRAPNTGEPCLQALALLRAGFFAQAIESVSIVAEYQSEDGCWEDPTRWGHHMWAGSGFKSWAIWEIYLFTHDREFLAAQFERMLRSARWSLGMRARTKQLSPDGSRPATYGLMPRGMGDCGLMDEKGDLFGVFYPHNFYHCMGLEIAARTARELGRAEAAELEANYQDLLSCILASLEKGAITAPDGSRWIPGLPYQTSGSRWGAASAIWPCKIIPPQHELASGTMRRLAQEISEGGLHKNLGWLKDGLWVAIAVDEISYAHLERGENRLPFGFLCAALNHATPLYSWCEERLPEKGTTTITGDLQHAWTPLAVNRLIRELLVSEKDGSLYLCDGIPPEILRDWAGLSLKNMPVTFGHVDVTVHSASAAGGPELACQVTLAGAPLPEAVYFMGQKLPAESVLRPASPALP